MHRPKISILLLLSICIVVSCTARQASPRVLFIVTSHSQLGDTGKSTGYYLSEAAHPWKVLHDAGIDQVLCIVFRRAEQITGCCFAAFLARFAAVHQHAFQVGEGNIRRTQNGCGLSQQGGAVILGQPVIRKVRAQHGIAYGTEIKVGTIGGGVG